MKYTQSSVTPGPKKVPDSEIEGTVPRMNYQIEVYLVKSTKFH